MFGGLAADDIEAFDKLAQETKPAVVVNCIGIVKQDAAAKDPITSITVNSLFPHKLAQVCEHIDARLIHLSTDCVFSGHQGNYTEDDNPDPVDLYGRTKLLGETQQRKCLAIRTSMIGRELSGAHGLIEWFLSQEGKQVRGFKRAIFSGFTTLALAELLAEVIDRHPNLSGLYHVSAAAISKFDLLTLVRDVYGVEVQIEPDENFVCDRSLNSARFRQTTDFVPPNWRDMIQRMHDDPTPYEKIRRGNA
jgi:dTDP-4-dehydrorhamnose reductase